MKRLTSYQNQNHVHNCWTFGMARVKCSGISHENEILVKHTLWLDQGIKELGKEPMIFHRNSLNMNWRKECEWTYIWILNKKKFIRSNRGNFSSSFFSFSGNKRTKGESMTGRSTLRNPAKRDSFDISLMIMVMRIELLMMTKTLIWRRRRRRRRMKEEEEEEEWNEESERERERERYMSLCPCISVYLHL